MSQFKQQYQAALLGALSSESAELAMIPDAVDPTLITNEDVLETQAERVQIQEINAAMVDTKKDLDDIQGSGSATSIAVTAFESAAIVSPIHSDTFVSLANESLKHSGRRLGTTLPSLEVADDGNVTQLSQEALGDWFKNALPAFTDASKRMVGRILLSMSQMRTSNKALTTRLSRVKVKMNSRRGTGGKPLKLSAATRLQLINGDSYTTSLETDLKAHWKLTLAAIELLMTYEERLSEHVKKRMVQALSGKNSLNFVDQIESDDLTKKMKALAAENTRLLGNRFLMEDSSWRGTDLLSYAIHNGAPDATVLVKHLDQPVSLPNEQIAQLVDALQELVTYQMTNLDITLDQVSDGVSALWSTLERLNSNWSHDANGNSHYQSLGPDVNAAELLRLENDVVEEMAEVCDRLATLQLLAINQVDAVLVLMEESIFQD